MPQIKSNFILNSQSSNFERDSFLNKKQMHDVNPLFMDNGHISFCHEDKKHYVFSRKNAFDPITGYFQLLETYLSISNPDLTQLYTSIENLQNEIDQYKLISENHGSLLEDHQKEIDQSINNIYINDESFTPDNNVIKLNIKTINGESILGSGNISIEKSNVDLSNYYTKSEIDNKKFITIDDLNISLSKKQDELISGINIKTINGESILGSGNISIEKSNVDLSNYYTKSEIDNKKFITSIPEEYITDVELNEKFIILPSTEYESLVTNNQIKENTFYFTY